MRSIFEAMWATLFLCACLSTMAVSIFVPPPLVMEASAVWAGNDGNWSTWLTQVGRPPQEFNVLPSTSHGEIWIPGPQGCTSRSTPLKCAASRGVGYFQDSQSLGFLDNASSTWEQIGIYEFIVGGDLFESTETGLYGQDGVVISSNVTNFVGNQTVASIVTEDFWVSRIVPVRCRKHEADSHSSHWTAR
jgi:hypothetical protein